MAGGQQESKNIESEDYALPDHEKLLRFIPNLWGSYAIETIIDGVLEHYINDEAGSIKDLWEKNQIGSNINLRNNLIGTIQKLNDMQPGEEIQKSKETILIPKNIDFFRMAFPRYELLEDGPDKISTRIGVLDKLNYNDSLEAIVRGDPSPEKIDNAEKEEINRALNSFMIHSSTDQMKHDLSNPAVTEGIEIFQKEYMETNWVNKESKRGEICKETLLAMNQALFDGWKRALYFYYPESGTEFYINDEDIRVNINDGKEIYAQETDGAKILMGTRETYLTHHGIRRYATTQPYTPGANAGIPEKVCSAIAKSEGNLGGASGGFDTINEYDPVCLSVGLFHWNRDGLWNLLNKFKTDSPDNFNTLIKQHGLDIKGYRIFVIEGKDYRSDSLKEELRRLTFVYRFIKAADNAQFRQAQIKHSQEWLEQAIGRPAGKGTVKQYITSQYGIALVLDFSVRIGDSERTITGAVNTAIQNALNNLDSGDKAKFTVDNPADWDDNMEIKIINAFNDVRKDRMKDAKGNYNEANQREENIKKTNLSKKRGSF
jgi:hypothetical protein